MIAVGKSCRIEREQTFSTAFLPRFNSRIRIDAVRKFAATGKIRSRNKALEVNHHKAMPWAAVPAFMVRLIDPRNYRGPCAAMDNPDRCPNGRDPRRDLERDQRR
jgi:hypothetical protein